MQQLRWKHALITGGSRGIGRGIALKLAESGIRKIAINYLENEVAAKETLKKVKDRGADGVLIRADVSKTEDIQRVFRTVKAELGECDVFIHNARPAVGAFYTTPLDMTPEKWQAAFDSQAKAMLLGCQEASRLMPNGGRIIAVTYAVGSRTGSWQPWIAMGGAKAALESTVRYFAVALAKKGITVNCVSPGATDDSVFNSLPEPVFKSIKAWHEGGWTPMGRMGTPADIGNVVALLCSDEAGWITGQTIYADGGGSLMSSDYPLDFQRGG